MKNDFLLIDIDALGRATVTLNRPEIHNAFDDTLIARLTAELKQLEADPQVRVVLLAANGRSFSAGADLNWMRRMADYSREENLADAMGLAELMRTLDGLSRPTIALVQGAAFGGGVGLAAACDIVLATPRASFCLSEVRLGLIPAVISPYVIAAIGARQARRYFLTAERFDAAEGRRLGLVHEIVEAEDLKTRAESLSRTLLSNGPNALAAAKRLVADVAIAAPDERLLADTAERIAELRSSAEGREGLNAFFEKRQPSWKRG